MRQSGATVAQKREGNYGLTKNILFILTQLFHTFCSESQADTYLIDQIWSKYTSSKMDLVSSKHFVQSLLANVIRAGNESRRYFYSLHFFLDCLCEN